MHRSQYWDSRRWTVSAVLNWEFGSLSSLEEPWMGRVGYVLVSLYLWVLVCVNLQYVVEAVHTCYREETSIVFLVCNEMWASFKLKQNFLRLGVMFAWLRFALQMDIRKEFFSSPKWFLKTIIEIWPVFCIYVWADRNGETRHTYHSWIRSRRHPWYPHLSIQVAWWQLFRRRALHNR